MGASNRANADDHGGRAAAGGRQPGADLEGGALTPAGVPLHAMRAVIPAMKRQGGGRIVNVSSVEGGVSLPLMAPYCASKFALTGLSGALRAELAQDGIYITTVAPGLMHSSSPADETAATPATARSRIVRTTATVLGPKSTCARSGLKRVTIDARRPSR
jgi:short-subunit dehydrogenase